MNIPTAKVGYPTFTIDLPMPSHKLTLNELKRGKTPRAKMGQRNLANAHGEWAKATAVDFLNRAGITGPYFPAGQKVRVSMRVERVKSTGKIWDDSAVIEALKPYMDAFQGNVDTGPLLYANDRDLIWREQVEWDEKPTRRPGDARIFLTFEAVESEPVLPLGQQPLTPYELHVLLVLAVTGAEDTFYAHVPGSDRMAGYCKWCHRRTDDHGEMCQGQERMTIAAKLTAMIGKNKPGV